MMNFIMWRVLFFGLLVVWFWFILVVRDVCIIYMIIERVWMGCLINRDCINILEVFILIIVCM